MNKFLYLIVIMWSSIILSQTQKNLPKKEELNSNTRTFIDNSNKTRINKDWSLEAEFKSGIGEKITFFPVQIIDLDTKKEINALQLDMMVKMRTGFGGIPIEYDAWIDYDEIDSFIAFIENHVAPNLELKYKEKSSEFIFQAKEITLKFLIHEKRKRLTVELNNSETLPFWTETQVDNLPKLLPMLKAVKNKELRF